MQFRIRLDLPQDLDAIHLGHPDIQQQQIRPPVLAAPAFSPLKQEVQRLFTVGKVFDQVVQSRASEVLLDEISMPFVVFGDQDRDRVLHGVG